MPEATGPVKAMNSPLERHHGLAFGAALAALAAAGIFSYRATTGLIEAQGQVTHTQEVMEQLDELVAQAVEAESAARGFVLSGESRYIESFRAAASEIDATLGALRRLIAENSRNWEALAGLDSALHRKLAAQANTIEIRRTGGLDAGLGAFLAGRGFIAMDLIRGMVRDMKDVERSLLRQRTASARREAENSMWGLLAGTVLSFAILLGVYYRLTREVTRRKHSEARLVRSNRLYTVLSEVNQAIVRIRERGEIFHELCRITVEHGGYGFAWLGMIGEDGANPRKAAAAGESPEWFEPPAGMPPGGRAVVCNDLADEGCPLAWRSVALQRGFRSAAALPIVVGTAPVGAFVVCAAEAGAFDGENSRLLHEVVSDVGFALQNLESEVLRREAEHALAESEERFRQMADNINEVFWLMDAGAPRLLYVSPAYERIWGRTRESAYAQDRAAALELIHPADREPVSRALWDPMTDGAREYEYRLLRADGSVRWIWDRAFPVRDAAGRVYRVAGIARDITDRKEAALALQVRVAQQRAVAELGRLAVENAAVEALLTAAVTRVAEVLNVEYCKVLELLPGEEVLLLRAGVGWKEGSVGRTRMSKDGDSPAGYTLISSQPVIVSDYRTEERFQAPDLLREHGVVSGVSIVIGDPRQPFGVLGAHSAKPRQFSEDDVHFLQAVASLIAAAVTRARAEAEIQRLNQDLERRVERRTAELAHLNRELAARNQEVERANRLKSEFLATMSHELRTPLNSVIGFTELLARQKGGPLNEKQRRFLGHIDEAARHLLQLISDILDLSRIEAGRVELSCEYFDLGESLAEVRSVIHPLAALKRLTLAAEAPPGTEIYADRIRFKQMLYNLLSNAVKFTPEGGRVWVECSLEPAGVRIVVADTGVGICAEEQEAIFDQFHQVGVTTSGVREGAGLGLAITRRLVDLHGGKIWVESQPEKGSRFIITLPPAETAGQCAGGGPA